jgi:hypothetical protein
MSKLMHERFIVIEHRISLQKSRISMHSEFSREFLGVKVRVRLGRVGSSWLMLGYLRMGMIKLGYLCGGC